MFNNKYFIYILSSKRNGTLYVGMTSNIVRRIYEHQNGLVDGFTKIYDVHNLVYYESFNDVRDVISREKQMKKWNRTWKMRIVEENNPDWVGLYEELSLI